MPWISAARYADLQVWSAAANEFIEPHHEGNAWNVSSSSDGNDVEQVGRLMKTVLRFRRIMKCKRSTCGADWVWKSVSHRMKVNGYAICARSRFWGQCIVTKCSLFINRIVHSTVTRNYYQTTTLILVLSWYNTLDGENRVHDICGYTIIYQMALVH